MRLKKIYVDQLVAQDALVHDITHRLRNIPVEVIGSAETVYGVLTAEDRDPVAQGKEVLYLTRHKGAFIKPCPGTQHYSCCGYKILHIGTYCHMDCAYCILQSYFHPPLLQFFVNHSDLSDELDHLFLSGGIHRVGTGEFTDSMIWEPLTDFSTFLVDKFSRQSRAVLELKSKTINYGCLKGLHHARKTIAAWSVNTLTVIDQQERGTSSLAARLKAASKCESWGYPLAFHFDPMIIYDGCEQDYRFVVEQIVQHVSADNIVWISLGTFRFMPSLKPIIQQRFPGSKIIYGEFIRGLDGKMRYFKPLRIALYKKMVDWCRELAPKARVYFCMEDDEVWRNTFGYTPAEKGGLSRMLDEAAAAHCGVRP